MLNTAVYMMTGKVTGKLPVPEAAGVARKAAEGGMVLLKNDGTLPMKPCRIALFGAGAEDTSICGTGSGYAFSPTRFLSEKAWRTPDLRSVPLFG